MLLFKAQMGFSSDSNYCIIFLILMKLLAFPTPFPLLQIIFIPLPSWGFLAINGRRKVGYVFTVFLYPLSSLLPLCGLICTTLPLWRVE